MAVLRIGDWNERELMEGEAYATTCSNVLTHILGELQSVEVMLAADKRIVVEITTLMEIAAKLSRRLPRFSADDLAESVREVFTQTEKP